MPVRRILWRRRGRNTGGTEGNDSETSIQAKARTAGKCRVLSEYSLFTEEAESCWNEEDEVKGGNQRMYRKVILVDYSKRKGSEVRNMLTADTGSRKATSRQLGGEARMAGMEEGIEKGIEKRKGRREVYKVRADFRLIKKSPDLTDEQK